MSELVVGSLKGLSANSFVIDVASGSTLDLSAGAVFPAGNVVQVVSTTKTDTFSVTNSTFSDVTGLSVSITPKATANKVYVLCQFNWAHAINIHRYARLVRDSTGIYLGDSAGSRRQVSFADYGVADGSVSSPNVALMYLDSPNTTSATTYKLQVASSSGVLYVNRTPSDTDNSSFPRMASSITVMEIAG